MSRLDRAIEAMKTIKPKPLDPPPEEWPKIWSWPKNGRNKKREKKETEAGGE